MYTIDNNVETNFLSRWCGWKKPNTLVSYYNIIIFAYHTDSTPRGSNFRGTFEFIDSSLFTISFCFNSIIFFLNLSLFYSEPKK